MLRATAVVVASLAALLTGGLLGTANADTGQPAPAPNIGEQLANSAANAPQVLQNLTTALTGTQPTPRRRHRWPAQRSRFRSPDLRPFPARPPSPRPQRRRFLGQRPLSRG
ncbi:hypothetical protein I553_9364 [Mycobacterium xenopi 4042]|uniref:Uncharacterized protein n=1 Tax=Mycobacterium xenopi 4042 TaxID=1299334 RepID=X8DZU9_MYCXE|nr:hypothetical protein I553_9364 [Mycobacterium xenopi 4042]